MGDKLRLHELIKQSKNFRGGLFGYKKTLWDEIISDDMTWEEIFEEELVKDDIIWDRNFSVWMRNGGRMPDYSKLLMSWFSKIEKKQDWFSRIETEKYRFDMLQNNPILSSILNALSDNLSNDLEELDKQKQYSLTPKQILQMVVAGTHYTVIEHIEEFSFFDTGSKFHDSIYDAVFFLSVSMFIQETTRIEGLTLERFLYEYSPMRYNDEDSNNYFNFDNPTFANPKEYRAFYSHEGEATTFRQSRYRLLKRKGVYKEFTEGWAMPKSSAYEWSFDYYLQQLDEDSQDIYMWMGKLFYNFKEKLKAPKDSGYEKKLEEAFHKFMTNLRKIDYKKLLKLQKETLSFIQQNERYYGINLLKYEKSFRLYNITNEVKALLNCKDDDEACNFIAKSIILTEVYFPEVYRVFSTIDDLMLMGTIVDLFTEFTGIVGFISLLVIDKYIEQGYFGDDWEGLFLETINDMAERVFYDPEEIDYSSTIYSREKFEIIIAAPVHTLLSEHIDIPYPDLIEPFKKALKKYNNTSPRGEDKKSESP